MKDRQTVESRLKELRREESRLSQKGLDAFEILLRIQTLVWVLEDGD